MQWSINELNFKRIAIGLVVLFYEYENRRSAAQTVRGFITKTSAGSFLSFNRNQNNGKFQATGSVWDVFSSGRSSVSEDIGEFRNANANAGRENQRFFRESGSLGRPKATGSVWDVSRLRGRSVFSIVGRSSVSEDIWNIGEFRNANANAGRESAIFQRLRKFGKAQGYWLRLRCIKVRSAFCIWILYRGWDKKYEW